MSSFEHRNVGGDNFGEDDNYERSTALVQESIFLTDVTHLRSGSLFFVILSRQPGLL